MCKQFDEYFKSHAMLRRLRFPSKSLWSESITKELERVITSDLTFREGLNHFTPPKSHERGDDEDVYDDVLSRSPK